jgi:hypothetical protein
MIQLVLGQTATLPSGTRWDEACQVKVDEGRRSTGIPTAATNPKKWEWNQLRNGRSCSLLNLNMGTMFTLFEVLWIGILSHSQSVEPSHGRSLWGHGPYWVMNFPGFAEIHDLKNR